MGGAGLGQQGFEVFAGDFQPYAWLPRVDQQGRFAQQAFFVQARRTGQRRQAGQQAQVVLAEHFNPTFGGHGGQAAASEFGEAVEVQQLALRKQHHERADRIVEQNRLHFARGAQAAVVEDFIKGNALLAQQQPNCRRRTRSFGGEGSVSHGVDPFSNSCRSITIMFNTPVWKLRRCSHLAVLLPMA
ncbi:hypothetical protein D3C87_1576400 [compost metagenome]